ncbi:MAG: response regulator [Alphaproteobacteria bacterium]|nr:response regulator [Alphaproteobacteria bacterium]
MSGLQSEDPFFPNTSILIVEDEHLVALYLKDIVDDLGFHCCGTAATAEDALSAAELLRPTLVLVDIHLAGDRDGIALACELRERLRIPVIFLSGALDSQTRRRAEAACSYGFLSKPCLEDDVANALHSALERLR